MVRTQLYVDEKLYRTVKALAARRRKTVSDMLREALRRTYGVGDAPERLSALEGAFGLWRGRTDIRSAEAFVRRLRKSQGRRWKR